MKRLYSILFFLSFCILGIEAQSKISSYLQQLLQEYTVANRTKNTPKFSSVYALVKTDDKNVFQRYHCSVSAELDDIYVAQIPLAQLRNFATERSVLRIEANRLLSITNDTTTHVLRVCDAFAGTSPLPQAFTGEGVVVGVMDIGFDFTHPTFDDRITYFWDMITDSIYFGNDKIKEIRHSTDGLICTHGTHTSGTAAGSGFAGSYSGMAPKSEIALVCNICSDNVSLIDSVKRASYTTANDILGFKRIFDYADSQGKPCVINFSEGAPEDPYNDILYYEALQKLVGPGHIIVSSAGNNNLHRTYAHKTQGTDSILLSTDEASLYMLYYVQATDTVTNTLQIEDVHFSWATEALLTTSDSILRDTVTIGSAQYATCICMYPDCYTNNRLIYEISLKPLPPKYSCVFSPSICVKGNNADVDIHLISGEFIDGFGETGHNINFPSSSPSVISVAASGFRDHIINYKGDFKQTYKEQDGLVSCYSSRGPTMSHLLKPDITAPGNNVISSYNSYYLEAHPNANDIKWDVAHFEYDGRTYPWNSNSGTSMSSPAVTGIIALWLEANPNLTPDDIRNIFSYTSRHPETELTYPNNTYGYGEINAYNGLLHILNLDAIISPNKLTGKIFPLQADERMTIYDLQGRRIEEHEMLSGSIYAIQIISPNQQRCGSMLIRK